MATNGNHELWYTSAPRGLYPGSSGYCVVKATANMPLALRKTLESLTSYRHLFSPNDPRAKDNPVGVSCLSVSSGGRRWLVLSRICDAGLDHTMRSNFFAHHLAIDADAARSLDPAWLAFQPGLLADAWDFRTEELAACRNLPQGQELLKPCSAWQAMCGDSGWAGKVAQALRDNERVTLLYEPGQPLGHLVREVFSLLPLEARGRIGFSTYFCGLPPETDCRLRCVVKGSAESRVPPSGAGLVLDLSRPLGPAPDSPLAAAARGGQLAEPAGQRSAAPGAASGLPVPAPTRADVDPYIMGPAASAAAPAPARSSRKTPRPPSPTAARLMPSAGEAYQNYSAKESNAGWATWLMAGVVGGFLLGIGGMAPLLFSQKNKAEEALALASGAGANTADKDAKNSALARELEVQKAGNQKLVDENAALRKAERELTAALGKKRSEGDSNAAGRDAEFNTEMAKLVQRGEDLTRAEKVLQGEREAFTTAKATQDALIRQKDDEIAKLKGELAEMRKEAAGKGKTAEKTEIVAVLPELDFTGKKALDLQVEKEPTNVELKSPPDGFSLEKIGAYWHLKRKNEENAGTPTVAKLSFDTDNVVEDKLVLQFQWERNAKKKAESMHEEFKDNRSELVLTFEGMESKTFQLWKEVPKKK